MKNKLIDFGSLSIGSTQPVVVIAEIGVNHEGSVTRCREMIDKAAEAGADAVKLQTVIADENYVPGTESYKIFKEAELSREETAEIFEFSRSLGMEIFTTAADFQTIDWVDELKPAAHKVSSGLLTSLPIIEYIASKGRSVLLSSGMSGPAEIELALKALADNGDPQFGLFQCTSLYPTPVEHINLDGIKWLADEFNCPVGISDHSLGPRCPAYAVVAGAVMVEKHFSLDPAQKGFDHSISLDFEGLTEMIQLIREAEIMRGTAEKSVLPELTDNRKKYLRCLVARTAVKKGEFFTLENLAIKRPLPGNRGLDPSCFSEVLGRTSLVDLQKNDSLQYEDFLKEVSK